jgi:diguanylate cyclase (GGDEF)-like protein
LRSPFRAAVPRTESIDHDHPVETGSIIRWRHAAHAMLVAGAILIEVGLLTGYLETTEPALVHVVAAMFVGLAALTSRVQLERYLGFSRVVIALSITAITLLVVAIDGLTFVPAFYIWPLLGAAYLLSRREVIAISGLTFAICGGALSLGRGAFPVADYVSMLLIGTVVVATVRVLSESLSGTVKTLRHSSLTDPLTGLLNRRGFEASLAHQYERARFDGRPITALLLDLDHFKAINDTFGHGVGDQALQRFAELLEASCRASDIVARVGGEEFAFVMPGATVEQALARAERFTATVRDDRAIDDVRMTVSVGIAAREDGFDDWQAMLEAADEAVYAAKRDGRDRAIVAPRPARQQAVAAV